MHIAVDGPAAAGKGTLARQLAKNLGLGYLETGRLYRAVAACLLAKGDDPGDLQAVIAQAHALDLEWDLQRPDLYHETTSTAAALVASFPETRAALLEIQRSFARHPPKGTRGVVLDGRDIGTVVLPNADVKFFLKANLEERVKRRYDQLRLNGEKVSYDNVRHALEKRDARDYNRLTAPLVAADDAVIIETSQLGIQDMIDEAMKVINQIEK